jgi:hypothetical protein
MMPRAVRRVRPVDQKREHRYFTSKSMSRSRGRGADGVRDLDDDCPNRPLGAEVDRAVAHRVPLRASQSPPERADRVYVAGPIGRHLANGDRASGHSGYAAARRGDVSARPIREPRVPLYLDTRWTTWSLSSGKDRGKLVCAGYAILGCAAASTR